MTERILPAYPLWLVDPLFSVWSKTDTLNAGDTVFWTGLEKRACGFVRWKGKTYSFLGRRDGVVPLEQTSLEVHAFSTDYTFRGEGFALKVRFLSPLLPGDLDVLSCPVCYTDYEVTEGEIPEDFSIALAIDEEFCYNGERSWVVGGVIPMKGFEAAYFTRGRNLVLSDTSDMCSPDWGDIYLAAKESWFISEAGLTLYLSEGKREYLRKDCERLYLLAVNTEKKGTFLTAFDDKVSVFYFGEWLKCYFFRNGKNILDALEFSFAEHARILSECEAFDEQLKSDCEKVGNGYYTIACASLRQSVAAHKLVETKDGKLLFLSKENNSNGCIGTADVSYPSIPLYLLYNPELVQGMLRGIYDFAKMPVWNFDFAPHDLGTYPWCSSQIYGTAQRDDKYCCGMYSTWASPRTNQMLYLRPAESEVYEKNMQMPVEECGNMLIMQAAAIAAGASCPLPTERRILTPSSTTSSSISSSAFPSSGRTSANRRLLTILKKQTATAFRSTRARTTRRRTGSCGRLRSQTTRKSAKSCMRPCLPISKGRLPAFPSAIGTIRRAAISCISSTVRSWAAALRPF